MMKVLFGHELDYTLSYPDDYFDAQYEPEWLTEPLIKDMIRDVDKSDIVDQCIISPVLGQISPEKLSGGVKSLIMIAHSEEGMYLNLTCLGQNCAKWLARLSLSYDFTVVQTGVHLSMRGYTFDAFCLNNLKRFNSFYDWSLYQSDFSTRYYDEGKEKLWLDKFMQEKGMYI